VKLYISHGADPDDWFIVEPREGQTRTSIMGTPITPEMAVRSLLNAGRSVYELDVVPKADGLYKLIPQAAREAK
jgi:hypothetical protein